MEGISRSLAALLPIRKAVDEQKASEQCIACQSSRPERSATDQPDHPLEDYSIHLYYKGDDGISQRRPISAQEKAEKQETRAESISRLTHPEKPPLFQVSLAHRLKLGREARQQPQYGISSVSGMTQNHGVHPEYTPDAGENIETAFVSAHSRAFNAKKTVRFDMFPANNFLSNHWDHGDCQFVPAPVRGHTSSDEWGQFLDDVDFYGYEDDYYPHIEPYSPPSTAPSSPISLRGPEPAVQIGQNRPTPEPPAPSPSREFRVMDEYLVPHVESLMRIRARSGQPVPEIRECKLVSAARAVDTSGVVEMPETLRVIRLPPSDLKIFDSLYWRNVSATYFVECGWDDETVMVEVPMGPWQEWWVPESDLSPLRLKT